MNWGKHKKEKIADKPKIKVPPAVIVPNPSSSAKPVVVAPPVIVPPPVDQPITEVAYVFLNWADPCPYYVENWPEPVVSGTEAPFRRPWQAMQTRDRILALGEYDERRPEIAQWRLEKAHEGKFDVFGYQVGFSLQHASKYPAWMPQLHSPLLYRWGPDSHPLDSPVRFFVSNWNAILGQGGDSYFAALRNDRSWNDNDVEIAERMYARECAELMKHPRYWKIDGKPVWMRGWAHTMSWYAEKYGFPTVTAQRVVQWWREEIVAALGVTPYLVATSMAEDARPNLKAWGFDALSDYLLHGTASIIDPTGWNNAMSNHRMHWAKNIALCTNLGIDYWIPATAGYDSAAWGHLEGPDVHSIPTAAQYEAHCREAREMTRKHYKLTRGIVTHYAWSEFGEGGIIEPMKPGMLHNGDEILLAHKAACS